MKDNAHYEARMEARAGKHPRPATGSALTRDKATMSFNRLRRTLIQTALRAIEDLQQAAQIKWAAEEASALSWATGYPLLLFPVLFEERTTIALQRVWRQQEIHERSRQLLEHIEADATPLRPNRPGTGWLDCAKVPASIRP
jgi:hypothetical protein